MWTFDGDEWTEESGRASNDNRQPETAPRFDEFTPELQVIEILPVAPRLNDWPFPPLQ
jgi:hypothetical protein